MKDLDAGQQREVEYLASQPSAWARHSRPGRLVIALLLAAVPAAVMTGFIALAGGAWLPLGLAFFCFLFAVLLFPALSPERALRAGVRMSMPKEESFQQGLDRWKMP